LPSDGCKNAGRQCERVNHAVLRAGQCREHMPHSFLPAGRSLEYIRGSFLHAGRYLEYVHHTVLPAGRGPECVLTAVLHFADLSADKILFTVSYIYPITTNPFNIIIYNNIKFFFYPLKSGEKEAN